MSNSITIAFIADNNERRLCTAKEGQIITVGSSLSSTICQIHREVCENHCNIRYSITYKGWVVERATSLFDTYLNQEIVSKAKILKNDDRLRLGKNGPILSVGIRDKKDGGKSNRLSNNCSKMNYGLTKPDLVSSHKECTNQQNKELLTNRFAPHSKDRNQPTFTYSLIFLAALAVCIVIFSTSTILDSQISPESIVTIEKYNRISLGMTYREVVEIIGKEGSEQVSSETEGIEDIVPSMKMKLITWENQDGSNITAMFTNQKLDTKAQFGLE